MIARNLKLKTHSALAVAIQAVLLIQADLVLHPALVARLAQLNRPRAQPVLLLAFAVNSDRNIPNALGLGLVTICTPTLVSQFRWQRLLESKQVAAISVVPILHRHRLAYPLALLLPLVLRRHCLVHLLLQLARGQ